MIHNFLFYKLPFDIIREILLYDKHFVLRKNENRIITINKICNLEKYLFLYNSIPKIYHLSSNSWQVIMGNRKRYILSHSLRPLQEWEYSYITFSKDPHTNMICTIPDSIIYLPL